MRDFLTCVCACGCACFCTQEVCEAEWGRKRRRSSSRKELWNSRERGICACGCVFLASLDLRAVFEGVCACDCVCVRECVCVSIFIGNLSASLLRCVVHTCICLLACLCAIYGVCAFAFDVRVHVHACVLLRFAFDVRVQVHACVCLCMNVCMYLCWLVCVETLRTHTQMK